MKFTYCPKCSTKLVSREDSGRMRDVCPEESCGFIHYDNPLPVVAGIVELDGTIVLIRNKGWPATLGHGLVTGFLERGESPEQGIVRELHEELGLDGKVSSLVGIYPFEMGQKNELIMAYHVIAQGEIVLGEELESFKRVPIEKLRPWPFATGLAVADWLAKRNAKSS